jgi:5-methylcytosine-specific restriction endonuclease McrA
MNWLLLLVIGVMVPVLLYLFFINNEMTSSQTKPYYRERIPSEVRKEVWNRDGGKCKKCGSRHHIEFDHIVPVSKGGSNSAQNIELLCKKCNRSKHAKIE